MKNMKVYLKRALVITLALLLICGIVYPLALTKDLFSGSGRRKPCQSGGQGGWI